MTPNLTRTSTPGLHSWHDDDGRLRAAASSPTPTTPWHLVTYSADLALTFAGDVPGDLNDVDRVARVLAMAKDHR